MKVKSAMLIATLLLSPLMGRTQFILDAVGLGADYNTPWNWHHSGLFANAKDQIPSGFDLDGSMFVQRYSLNYRFGFQLGKKSIFRVEADILQGTEYFNYYEGYSETRSNQGIDTVINWGLYAHTSGFLLGSRLKMRLSTPTDKRFHLFTCLGIEALSVSNSHSDASTYTSRYIKGQSQFGVMREDQQLSTKLVPNYYSINLLQQVGLAFRLSKKEEFFPMNKTYIELNVNILSNFTTVNSIREFNRSFGANLSLIYEFR